MKKIYLITTLSIFIIFVFLTIFYFQQKSQQKNNSQKIELQKNLDSLMLEHNNILKELSKHSYSNDGNIYHKLSILDMLRIKDSIIQSNAIEIKRLLETEYQYGIVLKKLMRLQKITQGYVRLLDSLYNENKKLKLENDSAHRVINLIRKENNNLFKKQIELKEEIETASYIKAYDIYVQTSKLKSNGKEKITNHNVNKLTINFVLGENRLIHCDKIITMKILQSNKEIIKWNFEVPYRGEQISIKKDFIFKKSLLEGEYNIQILDNSVIIGSNSFKLK